MCEQTKRQGTVGREGWRGMGYVEGCIILPYGRTGQPRSDERYWVAMADHWVACATYAEAERVSMGRVSEVNE